MRARHLAPATLVAVLLTGCGATSFAETAAQAAEAAETTETTEAAPALPTPQQLAHDTVAALGQVRSVGITETDLGHGFPIMTELGIDGADVEASVSDYFEAVAVGGTAYVRGSAEFWTDAGLSPQQADAVAWRWVTAPSAAIAENLPLSQSDAVEDLATIVRDTNGATVEEGRLAGRPVYILTLAGGGIVKIAAEGPAYPLEAGDGAGLYMSFGGFDEPLGIAAPPDAVDIREILGG